MTYQQLKSCILESPCTSYRLKDAIATFDKADPVKALKEAETLVHLLTFKVDNIKTYYHNTNDQNEYNVCIGCSSMDGDFIANHERENFPGKILCEIFVESGLLTVGENLEHFYKRLAKEAFDHFTKGSN